MLQYPAVFEPAAEGGYVVTFPDFKWGVTQGDTLSEAMAMAADALRLIIADTIHRGLDLPAPGKTRRKHVRMVALLALDGLKAALYRAWRESGMRKAELARRLNIPPPNLDRLFDLNHQSRLDQIEAAFRALNKRVEFEVRDAA